MPCYLCPTSQRLTHPPPGAPPHLAEAAVRFPDILTDAQFGEQASSLYADARAMLRRIIR